MGNFRIPNIPPTIPKTVRFPIDILDNIDELIEGRDCTFSAFVLEAVREAIKEAKTTEKI